MELDRPMRYILCLLLLLYCCSVPGEEIPKLDRPESELDSPVEVSCRANWESALKNKQSITVLRLSGDFLIDEDLKALPEFSKLKSLIILGIVSDGSCLKYLKDCKQLYHLECEFDDLLNNDNLKYLVAVSQLKSLSLNFDVCYSSDLVWLDRMTQLKSLHLCGACWVRRQSDFSFLRSLTQLEELDLCLDGTYYNQSLWDDDMSVHNSLQERFENNDSCIDDSLLKYLASLTKLKKLRLSWGSTDAGLDVLRHCKELETLDLSGCSITGTGFDFVRQTPHLKCLDLSDCRMLTDTGLKKISILKNLEELKLPDSTKLTLSGLRNLEKLVNLKSLSVFIKPQSYDCLKFLERLTNLENLKLYQSDFENEDTYDLDAATVIQDYSFYYLRNLTKLKTLDCSEIPITSAALRHLAKLKQLESIQLNCKTVDGYLFDRLLQFPRLKSFQMEGGYYICENENEEYDHQIFDQDLIKIAGLTELEELTLRGPQITGKGLAYLSGMKHLKSLSLYCCDIDDADVAVLENIDSLKELECCQVDYSDPFSAEPELAGISDLGLKAIGKMKNLESLSLIGNFQITDDGLAYLSSLTHLKTLYLDCTGITDEGLRHLSGLSELEDLSCRGSEVTFEGLVHLIGLKKLTDLSDMLTTPCSDKQLDICAKSWAIRNVMLNDNEFTDSGLNKLGEAYNLLSINLCKCPTITGAGFKSWSKQSPLTQVVFDECCNLTESGVAALKDIPRLKIVAFSKCDILTDSMLLQLKQCPGLLSIEVVNCPLITSEGIDELSRALPCCKIKKVNNRK